LYLFKQKNESESYSVVTFKTSLQEKEMLTESHDYHDQ